MGDGSLSKEEIDALLMGADDDEAGGIEEIGAANVSSAVASDISSEQLSKFKNTLEKILPELSKAATSVVGNTIDIKSVTIEEINVLDIKTKENDVAIESSLNGHASALIFSFDDASSFVKSMMGDSELTLDKMDESSLSTLSEFGNMVYSSLAKNITMELKTSVTPSAPVARALQKDDEFNSFLSANSVLKINYTFQKEDQNSSFQQLLAPASLSEWLQNNIPKGIQTTMTDNNNSSNNQASVNPVNYPSFQGNNTGSGNLPANIDLLMDVQMVLTVELGRTKKYVKEIFQLGEGSIIELDKLAGEPVDLLVNGKLIAKGEVVVIDENFGVRVTDIVGPSERLARVNS